MLKNRQETCDNFLDLIYEDTLTSSKQIKAVYLNQLLSTKINWSNSFFLARPDKWFLNSSPNYH